MSKNGTLISVADDQNGKEPKIVTPSERFPTQEFIIEVQKGNVPGHSILTKFGYASVSQTLSPITPNLAYPTPTTATALEFVSASADDATGGIGATKITYIGLDANWDEVTGTISTNGLTPVPLPDNLTRLYRWWVSESGSYASITVNSYVGDLTIREAGAGATWSVIYAAAPYPAQSEIAVTSIPRGYRAYIISKHLFTDSNKSANLYFLQRQNADDVTAPYSGIRRLIEREIGVKGAVSIVFEATKGPIYGPADIGFVGNVATGSADISVEFDLLLIQDGY